MKPNNLSELIPAPYQVVNVEPVVLLYRNNQVIELPELYALENGDYVFNYSKTNGFEKFEEITPVQTLFSAEEWLNNQSYSPIRLLTCLDFENKLTVLNKVSPKLNNVRAWINNIILTASVDPDLKSNNWPPTPYTFAEVSAEVISLLSNS
jgi:hypothetical protein